MSVAPWVAWREPSLERELLDAITLDAPWTLVERFAGLVRESGTEQEAEAVRAITARLDEWGVAYDLHRPVCWISLPRASALEVYAGSAAGGYAGGAAGGYGREARTVAAKTPAMGRSTEGEPLRGALVHLPAEYATGVGDLFSAGLRAEPGGGGAAGGHAGSAAGGRVAGKIVLTEGLPMPGKVAELGRLGARAAVFISPGERIHEGICTTIWGAPDLDSRDRQPSLPVVSVSGSDGRWLIEELGRVGEGALEVGVVTRLETRWRPIPVLVARIEASRSAAGVGAIEPERFVLLHGHLDSWHGGVGDNATGDATLLELARVFGARRDRLARSLRIAWWSGHSHGRYAGSTWYADTFGLDLAENCIAQVNCDSPGCRWATTYDHLTLMSETEGFLRAAVRDTTGLELTPERPPRAGDYSFNNIGVSGCLMLSSTMPEETRRAHGYYAVGGCGGNIAWHTEDDTLEIADRDNLLRDLRLYAAVALRLLNAPLHPLDFRATADELAATLRRYAEAAGGAFDFGPALAEVAALREELDRHYAAAGDLLAQPLDDPAVRRFNATARALGRLLVPLNYSRQGAFRHDPALDVAPLPDLAPALSLRDEPAESDEARIVATHLLRGRNRLIWAVRQARALVAPAPDA